MVEKAQFIDSVPLLCNLGIMWYVHYHSHLGEDMYRIVRNATRISPLKTTA